MAPARLRTAGTLRAMTTHAQDHGAHGSGPPLASELEPPKHAFDGVGHPAHTVLAHEDELERELHHAVAAEATAIEDLLRTLIEQPTTLGNEEAGQAVMRDALRDLGLEPVNVPMDSEGLRAHPAAAPFDWDVEGKANVVATWGRDGGGRSLILNGHIDVVPPDPIPEWSQPPFSATRDGGADPRARRGRHEVRPRGDRRSGAGDPPAGPRAHGAGPHRVGGRRGVHGQWHAGHGDVGLHSRRGRDRGAVRRRDHDVAGRGAVVPRPRAWDGRPRGRWGPRRERDRAKLRRDAAASRPRGRAQHRSALAL